MAPSSLQMAKNLLSKLTVAITKLTELLNNSQEENSSNIELLDIKKNSLATLFQKCDDATDLVDSTSAVVIEFHELEERYHQLLSRLNSRVRSSNDLNNAIANQGNGSVSGSSSSSEHHFKLPEINLPRFDGRVDEWPKFRDIFTNVIINSSTLNESARFCYLISCLKGEPKELLTNLEVSDANFHIAWDLLVRKYDSPRLIVNQHLDALLSPPQLVPNSAKSLQALINFFRLHVNALSNVKDKADLSDLLLTALITKSLPSKLLRSWELTLADDRFPTFEQLIDFLEHQQRGLRALPEPVNVDPNFKQKSNSAGPKPPKSFPCPVCKLDHILSKCPEFLKLTPKARSDVAVKANKCIRCLRFKRPDHRCDVVCDHCSFNHHTLLHYGNLTKPTQFRPQNPLTSVANFTSGEPVISLIPTAQLHAIDSAGKSKLANVILDTGTSVNLITSEFARSLRLPFVKTNVNIASVGHSLPTNASHAVKVTVQSSRHCQWSKPLWFLIVPQIPPSVARPFHTNNWYLPSEIPLADPEFNVNKPIHMLLAAESVADLILPGKMTRPDPRYPALLETKLGWVVLGATPMHCSLPLCAYIPAAEDLDKRIINFRETEEVIPLSPASSQEEQAKDKLKTTSSYSGKGNIRRTPAFRCDKSVLSHQSSNVDKKSRSVVDTRVRLSEDRQNCSESTSAEKIVEKRFMPVKQVKSVSAAKPLTKIKPKNTPTPNPKIKQIRGVSVGADIIVNGNSSVCGVNNLKDPKFKCFSPTPERTPVKERYANDLKDSSPLVVNVVRNKSNLLVNERFAQENERLLKSRTFGCEILRECDNSQKPPVFEPQSVVEDTLTNSLRAALKAPLPPGPPPKKPPRTFVHNSPDVRGKSLCSMIASEKSKTESSLATHSNGVSSRKKILERSTTEPHIMLKKLENVLLKHQQGIGSNAIAPRVMADTASERQLRAVGHNVKNENLNKCDKTLPHIPATIDVGDCSKDKKSVQISEKSAGGCFDSLNCVSNVPKHFYEKLNEPRSEFFVESPLLSRRKNSTPCESKSSIGQLKRASVGQSTSGEPIYAEPYASIDVEAILRAELSVKDRMAAESPAMLGTQPSKVVEPKTSTLHYMCTPINPLDRMDALLNSSSGQMTSKNNCKENGNSQITHCENKNNFNEINTVESKSEDIPLAQKSFSHFTVGSKNMQASSANVAIPKLDRSKLQLVINQAFGSPLHDSPVASLDSASSDESFPTTPDEMNPNDAHGEAGNSRMKDEGKTGSPHQSDNLGENVHSKHQEMTKLTEERKVYVRRVSSRIFNTRQRLSSQPFSNLFHCVMLIGLNLDGEKRTKVPYIKSKYPVNASVPPLIEHLCFPDAADWPPRSASESFGAHCDEQSYSLVITNETGDHMFGYCRRVVAEGMDICLPLAYCILSPYRAKGFYFKILSELESQHGQPEWLQKTFIKELYSCEFPNPGQTLKLSNSLGSVPGSVEASLNSLTSQLRRPLDSRLEEHDLTLLFSTLTVPILLQVFGSLLLERKVLFISNSLSKLSSCIEALHSILYPFSWQYTFIPVLPSAHIGVCEAPTPFVIGLWKDKVGKALAVTLEEGIIVDLEESKIVQCVGDESTILPTRLKKCLKMALHLVESTTQESEPARNVLISEAFVRMFVEICGHYSNHVVTQQDGKKVFERESFIKAVPLHSVQMFLEWFTETAMFSSFMESRLNEGSETKGLFEQRAMEHTEEMDKNTMLFLRNYKAINKKVKSFGDRLKDWTPFT